MPSLGWEWGKFCDASKSVREFPMTPLRASILATGVMLVSWSALADSPTGPDGKSALRGMVFRDRKDGPTHYIEKRYPQQPQVVIDPQLAIAAVFSPDGKLVATAGWDKLIRLWDAVTRRPIRQFVGHAGPVYSVAFSPSGRMIASGSEDHTIRLWDAASGTELRRLEGHSGGVTRVVFTPDGRFLASGSYDQSVRLWRVEDGRQIRQFEDRQKGFTTICFSPDGNYLASGCGKQAACLWETASGRLVRRFQGHRDAVVGTAFSPDGYFLATASEDRNIIVWEVWTARPCLQMRGHRNGVWTVAFSPDGRLLASAGRDRTIRFWDIGAGNLIGQPIEAHRQGIPMLAFSPDGQGMASASHDGTAAIWDVAGVRPAEPVSAGPLSEQDLAEMWKQLALPDAAAAYGATARHAAAPRQTVPLIHDRVRPIPHATGKRVARLIANLDNNSFRTRQQASEELEKFTEAFRPALRQALEGKPSLEARQRIERLSAGPITAPELLRALRCLRVLERAGTPEARAHLATLAAGAPGALLTETAHQALGRMASRESR